MDLKELEWKLLEWQEIRKLFPSSNWIKQIVDKLRKWTTSVPTVGRGRRRRWARNLWDLVRIYREIQNNIYMYSILLYIINKHPQCRMLKQDVPEGIFLFPCEIRTNSTDLAAEKAVCGVGFSQPLTSQTSLLFPSKLGTLLKVLLCPTKLVLAASSASPKHFSPAAPEL